MSMPSPASPLKPWISRRCFKDAKPAVDPLAAAIPADQHAIFFPSFEAALTVADEANGTSTPILILAEERAEDSKTKERYQRQLCLPMTGLGRLLGPSLISSVAITGSDAYLRTGSDLAILLEPKDAGSLLKLLSAQMALQSKTYATAKAVAGQVQGVQYTGAVSPDRVVSAYLAQIGDAVVVTNSLAQISRLAKVHAGQSPALAAAPEYLFFRSRYPRADTDETGFMVLSDATIRRWCSARWRIADSRRTRAAAVMAELQANALDSIVTRKVEPGVVQSERPVKDAGTFNLSPTGITSDTYGSLEFLTPIAELDFSKVTPTEAQLYDRWRTSYQQNWSWAFDPIAVRFAMKDHKLSADLTVMPLIANTDYRELIDATSGVKLAPESADPHDSIFQIALAINPKSQAVQQFAGMAKTVGGNIKIDPFAWLGNSISLYADDSPFWDELAKADDPQQFMSSNFWRLPVALYVESSSAMKLTLFLTALRTYIDQSAPGMTGWETIDYKDQPYVKIASKIVGAGPADKLAIYYAATSDAWIVSLSEDVLKKAIDRQAERHPKAGQKVSPATSIAAATTRPWLGESETFQIDRRMIDTISRAGRKEYQTAMQAQSWANLIILNEWKRLYPAEDPVALHERLWQTRLVCPGGGRYVWNDQLQTMESTIYGSPASPKSGPATSPLNAIRFANLGLTFENKGLRAGQCWNATQLPTNEAHCVLHD